MKLKSTGSNNWRINVFIVIIFAMAGGITYRLFYLTFVKHSDFVKSAKAQYENPSSQLSERGNVYFSDVLGDRHLAATNQKFIYVYSNNSQLDSADEASLKIADVLGVSKEEILIKLSDNKEKYVVLADRVSEVEADKIRKLNIKGISIANGIDRIYPEKYSAASTLGFVGFEGFGRVGQYGVEAFYDYVLSGEHATQNWFGNETYSKISDFFKSLADKDAQNSNTADAGKDHESSDVVLTIDKNIQSFIESKLDALLLKWESPSGLIIVEDPNTGAILGLASSPSFDPNHYDEFGLASFINPATQKLFEPGSSFKPITMAGALDKGVIKPDTTYEDTGAIVEAGYVIKNFDERTYGIQTMRQVLEKSLNTGSIFAQSKLGNDDFLNYVVAFGFGQKSGIDLPGEINGNISNLFSGRKINFMTASFGQGIAVTPIQLVNAYSSIANGGKLLKPYVAKEIIREDGSSIKVEPEVLGQPISDRTALTLKSMLTDVVDNGFDKARIPGYDVAGKTGTAQISDPGGGYSDEFIHNFIGFAPSYKPRFVILIKMDRPKGERFASNTLTPTFADITRFLINYMGIPPTRR